MSLEWSKCKCEFTVEVTTEDEGVIEWIYSTLAPAMEIVFASTCDKDHHGRAAAFADRPQKRSEWEAHRKQQLAYARFLVGGLTTYLPPKNSDKPACMKGTVSKAHVGAAHAWASEVVKRMTVN